MTSKSDAVQPTPAQPNPPAPFPEKEGGEGQQPADMTAALLAKIALLETKIAQVEAVANKKVVATGPKRLVRSDRPGEGGAWMIQTQRQDYAGETCGVTFVGGMAFVDVEQAGADELVHRLEFDHGYQVTALEADALATMRKAQAMRGKGARSLAEKLVRPAVG